MFSDGCGRIQSVKDECEYLLSPVKYFQILIKREIDLTVKIKYMTNDIINVYKLTMLALC